MSLVCQYIRSHASPLSPYIGIVHIEVVPINVGFLETTNSHAAVKAEIMFKVVCYVLGKGINIRLGRVRGISITLPDENIHRIKFCNLAKIG